MAELAGLEGLEGLADQLPRLQRLARLLAGQRHDADDLLADALAATYPRWRDGRVDDLGVTPSITCRSISTPSISGAKRTT